jgi:predicted phosphodiesterase
LKRAIISDIHANLEALEAVLEDIRQQGVDEVYCLGDIVGYGANPRECIDRVMDLTASLLGNHDQGALFDPDGFSGGAERAIFWTREQLEHPLDPNDSEYQRLRQDQVRRWTFLCELPRTIRMGELLLVHGSARNPLSEYVFPEDVGNTKKMERIFDLIPRYCFQGHTHVPGIFTESHSFLRPDELSNGFQLGTQKVMVNVGSVGQPRDGDPRACYTILEGNTVVFRRVDYPVQRAAEKIYAVPELDRFLGDRLLEGR